MSPGALGEHAFEVRVEDELLRRGWVRGQGTYSAELGLDTAELFKFVGATQAKAWAKLVQLYGGDPNTAQKQFALRVASEIDARGVLDVLRQGVKDRGCCWRRTRWTTTTRTC
jgi:type I restriction enzyme R subunit